MKNRLPREKVRGSRQMKVKTKLWISLIIFGGILVVLAAALIFAVVKRQAIAEWAIAKSPVPELRFDLTKLGVFGAEIRNLRFEGKTDFPVLDFASVRFTPRDLLNKRLGRVEISGVRATLDWPDVKLPPKIVGQDYFSALAPTNELPKAVIIPSIDWHFEGLSAKELVIMRGGEVMAHAALELSPAGATNQFANAYNLCLKGTILESPLEVKAVADLVSGRFGAEIPRTNLATTNAPLKAFIDEFLPPNVKSIDANGKISASATGTFVPSIDAKIFCMASEVEANVNAAGTEINACGGSAMLTANFGISGEGKSAADFTAHARVASAEAAGFSVTNIAASCTFVENTLIIDNSSAEWCGGTVSVYSLRMRAQQPENVRCVVFAEKIDVGEIIGMIKPLRGTGTGLLYGSLPLQMRDGRFIMGEAYLYALPGEVGTLKLQDTEFLEQYLRAAGLTGVVRDQLRDSLSNLTYNVLRFNLASSKDCDGKLSLIVRGRSAINKDAPPVELDININGPLEMLLNIGIQAGKRK